MADGNNEWNAEEANYSRNAERLDDYRSNRRDRDYERHSRRRDDSDRRRDDDSRRHRRRSRSRSGSRERRRRRDREEGRNEDRRRSYDDDGSYGPPRGDHSRADRSGFSDTRDLSRRDGRNDDGNERLSGNDWRSKLTSIRNAHFNRNKQAPTAVLNQFRNDGSFLEMFKKKMAEQSATGEDQSSVTPNSLVLASSSIPFSPGLSLPPLTTTVMDNKQPSSSTSVNEDQDLDGVPMPTHKPVPVPVSVGKRRLAKPLKTGIVHKKPSEPEEDEASQEKLDAWARYLQEVQKYKATSCVEEDNSRPLVK